MKLHFATVPVFHSQPAEAELNQFLASRRVIAVEPSLIHDGPRSTWAVCVTYVEHGEFHTVGVLAHGTEVPCYRYEVRFADSVVRGMNAVRVSGLRNKKPGILMPGVPRNAIWNPSSRRAVHRRRGINRVVNGEFHTVGVLAHHPEVREFAADLHASLSRMHANILSGKAPEGRHGVLLGLLERRFKDPGVLRLCLDILERTPDRPGKGLPIGALTSQHFANTYLDGLDRLLLEKVHVRGLVRYMDDLGFWCDTRAKVKDALQAARMFAAEERRLELKPTALLGRSESGLSFLGFRIHLGRLRLSLRRRRRYSAARARWEGAFERGEIDASQLQRGYSSALAVTAHADAGGFRRAELVRHPAVDA